MTGRRLLGPFAAGVALLVVAGCSTITGTAQPAARPGDVTTSASDTAGGTTQPPGTTSGEPPQITTPPVTDSGATTSAPSTPSDPVPAGLERFYQQQLDWTDCDDFADDLYLIAPSQECARLVVPLNYADPEAAEIRIAVIRIPSESGAPSGSLLFNPGGPGASGLEFLDAYGTFVGDSSSGTGDSMTQLSQSFDLVSFDPRGVGASEPRVSCLTDAERDEARAQYGPVTEEYAAAADEWSREYVGKCTERTVVDGVDGDTVLSNLGTRDTARDMDVLRAALGDDTLSYVGFSYGTMLGYVYADEFEQNVRAMVLDGAVAPNADPVTSLLSQAQGFQDAFDSFAAWCVTQSDCPLGDDLGRTTEAFQQLAQPLVTDPIDLSDGRILTFSDATTGVAQALYLDAYRQTLLQALIDLKDGKGEGLMALADSYLGRAADGTYSNMMEAFDAIRCMDDERITDPEIAQQLQHKYTQAAPFSDDGQPVLGILDVCAFWPGEPTWTSRNLDFSLQGRSLVISTTGDPATPYQDGVDLAKEITADLLTFVGDRHTAFLGAGSACVDDAVIAFLLDPQGAPRTDEC